MKRNLFKPLATITLGATLWLASTAPAAAYSYKVQAGDTLYQIAQSQGITLESIQQANPNAAPLNLQIGQVIEVPMPNEKTHTVQSGETYWTISKKLNISLNPLMKLNPTLHANNLYAGLKLRLPGSSQTLQTQLPPAVDAKQEKASAALAQTVSTPDGDKAYKQMIQAKASAYTADPAENGGWAGLDYMGNKLKVGTIAVDPTIIPLGTRVYVTGYDYNGLPSGGFIGQATDVGGAIKEGNRIDIYVPQSREQALKFGLQEVTVYILE